MADKKISELGDGGAANPGDLVPVSRGAGYAYVDLGHFTRHGQLPRWRAALGKYRAGTSNARMIVAGDSVARGYGASTTGNLQYSGAINTVLAKHFIKHGEKASYQAVMGNGNVTQTDFDARLSLGSWVPDASFSSIGGELFSTSGTSTFSFTPNENTNACDIWYVQYGGGGTFTKQANSVTGTDVSTDNATAGLVKTSLTAASVSATNIYKVIGKSGTNYVCGFEAYDNTSKQIICANGGYFGSECDWWTLNGFDANPWDPNNCWGAALYDLVVFDCGGNDLSDGKTPEYMMTEYQKIIDAVKLYSDMIIMIDPGPDASFLSAEDMKAYVGYMYQLAATNNIPVIDMYNAWGGDNYTFMNSLGMFRTGDPVHPSAYGYSDYGTHLAKMLLHP